MRVWTVRYRGEAAEMVDMDLHSPRFIAAEGIVRCGGAGATWKAWMQRKGTERGEDFIDVVLEPIDPHDADPSCPLVELVMPSEFV
jgi:hypothetical protein